MSYIAAFLVVLMPAQDVHVANVSDELIILDKVQANVMLDALSRIRREKVDLRCFDVVMSKDGSDGSIGIGLALRSEDPTCRNGKFGFGFGYRYDSNGVFLKKHFNRH